MAIRSLTEQQVSLVSGGGATESGLVCAGTLATIAGSEGTALLVGAGLAAVGSCKQFLDDVNPPSTNKQGDSGTIRPAPQPVQPPPTTSATANPDQSGSGPDVQKFMDAE